MLNHFSNCFVSTHFPTSTPGGLKDVDVHVDPKSGYIDVYRISSIYGNRHVSSFLESSLFREADKLVRRFDKCPTGNSSVEFYNRHGDRNDRKADQSTGFAMMHPLMYVVYMAWLERATKTPQLGYDGKAIFMAWLNGQFTEGDTDGKIKKIRGKLKKITKQMNELIDNEPKSIWTEADAGEMTKLNRGDITLDLNLIDPLAEETEVEIIAPIEEVPSILPALAEAVHENNIDLEQMSRVLLLEGMGRLNEQVVNLRQQMESVKSNFAETTEFCRIQLSFCKDMLSVYGKIADEMLQPETRGNVSGPEDNTANGNGTMINVRGINIASGIDITSDPSIVSQD